MTSFFKIAAFKFGGMFRHILPLYLAVFYLFYTRIANTHAWPECAAYMMASFFVAVFGYLLNDACDVKQDCAAQKRNMFSDTGKVPQVLLFTAVIFFASLCWYFAKASFVTTVLLLIEFGLFILYSAPSVRFKNNPILGPLCDAMYAHVLPVLISLYYLNAPLSATALLFLAVWLLMKGLRNILLHQVDDRKGDKLGALGTFPVKFGIHKTLKILIWWILPLELLFLIAALAIFYPFSTPMIISFALYHAFFFLVIFSYQFQKRPLRYYYFKVIYYLNNYYEFWLPVTCIFMMNASTLLKLAVACTHLIFYHKKLSGVLKDLKTIVCYRIPEIKNAFVFRIKKMCLTLHNVKTKN